MPKLPLSPTAVWSVVKEVRVTDEDLRPLLVAGAPEHAKAIYDGLAEGANREVLRDLSGRAPTAYDLEGANVLVYAVDGPAPGEEDEKVFQLAVRKRVGIVCVLFGVQNGEPPVVPNVLDSDVIAVGPGKPLPLELVAERIAERADETAHHLAARIPALRPSVVEEEIVTHFSRQNGVLGVAIFIPGADFPVLTLNQIRMVLRIATAYGEELDRERAFEVLSVVAAGLGFRTLARHLVTLVPGFGWAVKGGVAYAATRAVGEAASAYFAAGGTRMIERSSPVPVLAFSRMEREERQEVLLIEEADAWFEYLEATQAEAETGRYDEVEPWAWARLNQRLRAVERKRAGLRPAAA